MCNVNAIANLAKGRQCDLQKVQTVRPTVPAKTFNDIKGYGERRAPQLRPKLEPL